MFLSIVDFCFYINFKVRLPNEKHFWVSEKLIKNCPYPQMTMAGPGSYYSPEYVFSDPAMQTPSPSGQGPPPTMPAEMMTEMAFQRPEVYDAQMQTLPQYMASNLSQHQNIISQISQPHPSLGLPPHHPAAPPATVPASVYTPGSVIYIEGDRDGSQILH